ncbi:MAG: glycosyltransferase [Bacteroidota bacterium]
MNTVIYILAFILLTPVLWTGCYLLFFSLLGKMKKDEPRIQRSRLGFQPKIVVLIPAYKEDQVIIDTADNILQQTYSQDKWDAFVIADSFESSTLLTLRQMGIGLIEVAFENSTKSKALNKAMGQLQEEYDLVLILDADNHVKPEFLEQVVMRWKEDTEIAQCHRTAKNKDTGVALLDTISEEVANHIFSKGHRAIGLSSRLVGSGMVFKYPLFKSVMQEIQAIGGFDKELEVRMMAQGKIIDYYKDLMVFDEKVRNTQSLQKQRLRWISSQFVYLGRYFGKACQALIQEGNVDLFNKVLQFTLAPRLIYLGLCSMAILLGFISSSLLLVGGGLLGLLLIGLAYALALPPHLSASDLWKSIGKLPSAMLSMIWQMRKIKGANKKFIHTPHGATTPNNN